MPGHEHRRVANQPHTAKGREEWEQLRRVLLAVVAQFKATDPDGCYTLDVRVAARDSTTARITR